MAKCAQSTDSTPPPPPPPAAAGVLSPLWRAGRLVGIYHCHSNKCISLLCAMYSVALAALTIGVFVPCCVYDLLQERLELTWIVVNKTITFLFSCMMLVSMAGVWWAQLKAHVYIGALDDIIVNSKLDARQLQSSVSRTVTAIGVTIVASVGTQVAMQAALLPDVIYVIQPLRSLGLKGPVARCADAAMLAAWGLHAYGVIARLVFDVCLACAAVRRALRAAAAGLTSATGGGRADAAAWRQAAARVDSAVGGMEAVNALYGWPLLLLVSATLCQVLLCIYYMLLTATSAGAANYHAAGTNATGAFAVQASWLALGLLIMAVLFEFADGVKRAATSAVRSLRRMSHASLDAEAKESVQWLIDNIAGDGLALSAAGFFHFDRTCIVASVSTVATYLIVLLQTHDGSAPHATGAGDNATVISA